MNLVDIKNILQSSGESETIELKKSTASLQAAAQTLCGFLNGVGGTVYIGIANNHKIVGQEVNDKTKLEISNILKKFEPTANINIEYISLNNDLQIIAMEACPDSYCLPYSFDGRAYERKQADTHIMSQARYQQLLLKKSNESVRWENQIALNISIDDLDHKEIIDTVTSGIQNNLISPSFKEKNISEILTHFGLMKGDHLVNAAVVLFIKNPKSDYIQCRIRMARFKGTKKGSFIDNKQASGNVFFILEEAENFIRRNTAVSGEIIEGKMKRQDTPEYIFDAVRESLINALCHRDYALPGGAITLIIYDDRLEIINTGMLPEGITIDKLKLNHSSYPRNPNITKIFYRRGLIEEMGIGTQEIVQVYRDVNMKEPEFHEESGTFSVCIWSRLKEINLTDRQNNIINILSKGKLSPNAIWSELGENVTDRTLRRELSFLNQEGYITNNGQKGSKTLWYISAPDMDTDPDI